MKTKGRPILHFHLPDCPLRLTTVTWTLWLSVASAQMVYPAEVVSQLPLVHVNSKKRTKIKLVIKVNLYIYLTTQNIKVLGMLIFTLQFPSTFILLLTVKEVPLTSIPNLLFCRSFTKILHQAHSRTLCASAIIFPNLKGNGLQQH